MNRNVPKLYTRRFALVAPPLAFICSQQSVFAQGSKDFVIGAIASLSGAFAPFSREFADGFTAYVKIWNDRGGYVGRKVALELLDDETSPVNALNAFRRLAARDEVMVIWAALGSQTALGIKAVASEFKIPVISGGGVDALGIPADPYFFKVSQGSSHLIKALLQWAEQNGIRKLAMLTGTDAAGQSDAQVIRALTASSAIKVVAAESFALSDTNFTSQLVKIGNAAPELVYSSASGNPAILVIKQYRQLEIKSTLAVSFAAVTSAFFQATGGVEKAEGMISVIPLGALGPDMPGMAAALYRDASTALGKPAQLFHTIGWDTGILTEHAVRNSDATRNGIRAALDNVKDLPAINGPFSFTPANHIGQDTRGLVVARLKSGKWTQAM